MQRTLSGQESQEQSRKLRKRFVQISVQLIGSAAVLSVSAGSWEWTWCWVYVGVSLAVLMVNSYLLPRELIAERAEPEKNVKSWDWTITRIAGLLWILVFVVAGLEERYRLSDVFDSWIVHGLGIFFVLTGSAGFTWAMLSNRNFSTMVRIQIDRGHSVATGGPYKFLRHPGYACYIVSQLATPLLFGSLWAQIPSLGVVVCFVVRTHLEDTTLMNELQGYQDYAAEVRYRLIPGVW